jgi:hypothetical protein
VTARRHPRLYGHGHVGPDGRWIVDRKERARPIEEVKNELAKLTRRLDRMRRDMTYLMRRAGLLVEGAEE